MVEVLRIVLAGEATGPAESKGLTGRLQVSDECGDCGRLFEVCIPHATGGVCGCTPCERCASRPVRPPLPIGLRGELERAIASLGHALEVISELHNSEPRWTATKANLAEAMVNVREVLS
jgi:hypothetical protein